MKKLHLISLGCTKNLIDSEVMLAKLKEYEITQDITQSDLIIVNSCGFIDSAKEESINTVLQAHSLRKKDSILVFAGCMTQRYKEELQKELNEVDIFTGVGDYDQIDELVKAKKSQFSDKVFLSDTPENRIITNSNYHAFIKLSEGCNQACSFCAIPSFKGKLHSRTLQSVVKEVTYLVGKGFFDFSFVSQDSSSYLRDYGISDGLEQLIDEIDKIKGVKSARVLYLYPSTTTPQLIEKIKDANKFHNYYDMPIQHISSNMLKLMKRGKNKEATYSLVKQMLNTPNSLFRTSFIVGHPNESEEDFNELCSFVEEEKIAYANVFGYSDEENTTAFKLENKISQEIINQRAEILGEIISKNLDEKLKSDIGKTFDIVIDGYSNEHEYLLSAKKLMWAPEVDGEIYINDNELETELEVGKIYKAKVTEVAGDKLIATVIE